MEREEIIKKMRELDRRMINLPVGETNAEYDTLEVEYERLRGELWRTK